jgi:hypothetical protein
MLFTCLRNEHLFQDLLFHSIILKQISKICCVTFVIGFDTVRLVHFVRFEKINVGYQKISGAT